MNFRFLATLFKKVARGERFIPRYFFMGICAGRGVPGPGSWRKAWLVCMAFPAVEGGMAAQGAREP